VRLTTFYYIETVQLRTLKQTKLMSAKKST